MQKLEIREPIWRPVPAVGISEEYSQDLEIEITHKKSDGTRMYPHTYFIEWDRLKYYPSKKFKKGMPMIRVVPITMLEVSE